MAEYTGVMFTVVFCVCLFSFPAQIVLATGTLGISSCGTVAGVFEKLVGPADNIPVSPIPDATLNQCAHSLPFTGGASCCTADMESQFLHAAQEYLRKHITVSNSKLKDRIIRSLNLFQEHLRQSMQDAHGRTSDTLQSLFKIPKEVHKKALDELFDQLNRYFLGQSEHDVSDIINTFFARLFPVVFEYVLSSPQRSAETGDDFSGCLTEYHDQIEPFGNVPKNLGKKVKYAFQRARLFTETLHVLIKVMNTTNTLEVDHECTKGVTHLHFCSMCTGEAEARPCRGFCLNVMRGCLSKVSEISSSWDDVVVAFENLQLGLVRQTNAQELLAYMDGNITQALLKAMDEGPRIYDNVMAVCRESSQQHGESEMMYKRFSTPEGLQPSQPSSRISSMRKDISSLITQLEDSKGFLQRLADGLCRAVDIYDQEMQSHQCWNGSAVGSYMHEVPEAGAISQVQHNREVKVSLIPNPKLLEVKDALVHARRSLNALFNEELMLSDQSYNTVAGSGAGGTSASSRDVIIDDEDFVDKFSGSGSGDGPDKTDDKEDGGKPTEKPTHPEKRPPSGGDGKVGGGGTKSESSGPKDSAGLATLSFILLLVCAAFSQLHTVL